MITRSILGLYPPPIIVPGGSEIWLLEGDSLQAGVLNRETMNGDWSVLPSGIKQYGFNHASGLVSTLPLDCPSTPANTNVMVIGEYFIRQRQTDTGHNLYIIQRAIGGSSLINPPNDWQVGGTNHEQTITTTNAAIAAIQAVDYAAVFAGYLIDIGTNDTLGANDPAAFYTKLGAGDENFRSRVFANGLSGATITNCHAIFMGMMPEHRQTNAVYANATERAMMRVAKEVTNGRYFAWPIGMCLGDNLHPTLAANRSEGPIVAGLLTSTVAPTISLANATIANGAHLYQQIAVAMDSFPYISGGADAALFEIIPADVAPSGSNSHLWNWFIRFAGDATHSHSSPADANADNVYEVTVSVRGANGQTSSVNSTTTVASSSYPAVSQQYVGVYFNNASNEWAKNTFAGINIKVGTNLFYYRIPGPVMTTWGITVNGTPGVVAAHSTTGENNAVLAFYSAVEVTGATVVVTFDYGTVTAAMTHTVITGAPMHSTDSDIIALGDKTPPSLSTKSFTCPSGGIVTACAIAVSSHMDGTATGTVDYSGPWDTIYQKQLSRQTNGALGVGWTSGANNNIVLVGVAWSP